MHPPSLGTIRQVVCPEMCGNFYGVTSRQEDKLMDRQANSYVPLQLWWRGTINSLAPGKFEWNFRHAIFKQILVIDGWGITCEIALIWISLDFADDPSTLVQVMAWCRQATSHYLSQCWPRSLSPYGITRPQWVNCEDPFHCYPTG